MATYKKPLKYFDGRTLGGYSFTAEDADGKRLGSYAIDAFEAHKTITAEVENKKVLVPFHAVKTAMYGTMTEDAEKADAYCGGGTEPIGDKYHIVFQSTQDGITSIDGKFDIDIGDAVTAPSGCGMPGYSNPDIGVSVNVGAEFTLTEEIASQLTDKTLTLSMACR
ncbi:MAG: hypothetical protein U0L88_08255 [Acutalibacteraceae bacterium]|nr:hypothetical protein [Acutalibacteraceae bacterium]